MMETGRLEQNLNDTINGFLSCFQLFSQFVFKY